jgi:type VI secretion system protein
MAGRGLLSRLGKGASHQRSQNSPETIVAHLRALLNTRMGGAVTVPDLGIIDFVDVVDQYPTSIQTLQRSIRDTLSHYEPRLTNVTVRFTPGDDPLVLRFEILAQLVEGGGRQTLRIQTQMSPGGKVDVW